MKPRTILEKEVAAISKKMQPLSSYWEDVAYKMNAPHIIAKRGNGKCYCLDCGHEFIDKSNNENVICPNCKTKSEVAVTKKRKWHDVVWWNFITTQQGYQVVRGYCIETYRCIGIPVQYKMHECVRTYINNKGQQVVMALNMTGFAMYRKMPFNLETELSIKRNTIDGYGYNKYAIDWDAYCHKLIEPLRRCGYKNTTCNPVDTLTKCLEPHWQTLLEAGYLNLFSLSTNKMQELWAQIKICMRNHYKIPDVRMWTDTISNLVELGMDTHSPKYICPDNLKEFHNTLLARIRKKREKEEEEAKMERLNKAFEYNEQYKKDKGKFFSIMLSQNSIEIKPIQSVEGVKQEGDAMNHCVFTNEYFKKTNSLLLSATENGKRIATIEYDLTHFEVLQCRGQHNEVPENYEDILKLLESNKNKFKKAKEL